MARTIISGSPPSPPPFCTRPIAARISTLKSLSLISVPCTLKKCSTNWARPSPASPSPLSGEPKNWRPHLVHVVTCSQTATGHGPRASEHTGLYTYMPG
eukprot:COSAG01_NODE_10810_length_2075_cov_8.187247_2_plen_99_part_00